MNLLPKPVVAALQAQSAPRRGGRHTVSDYSATELIKPPLMTWIAKNDPPEYQDKDILDNAAAMYGTALHDWLRRQAEPPLYAEVPVAVKVGDKILTSEIDLVDTENKIIYDYKLTKFWSVKKALEEGTKWEWEQQLNIYRWMLANNDPSLLPYPDNESSIPPEIIKELQIVAFIKDYGTQAKNAGLSSVEMIKLPVWDFEGLSGTESFIHSAVKSHEQAKTELPRECTTQEKWQRVQYKIEIDGKLGKFKYNSREKAASKVLSRKKQPKEWEIIEELGEPLRCQSYCAYREKCPYFNSEF